MEKIKAYRHDLVPSDAAHGIRGYECETGWFVSFYSCQHREDFALFHHNGKCRFVEGDDYRRLVNKLELIEKGDIQWQTSTITK